MSDLKPHHLNAPGPFFVEKDQCIACRAPENEAPELMSFDEQGESCYFHRQPQSPEEIEHAIQAVWVACCDVVHYDGDDPKILVRLRTLNEGVRLPKRISWRSFWAR